LHVRGRDRTVLAVKRAVVVANVAAVLAGVVMSVAPALAADAPVLPLTLRTSAFEPGGAMPRKYAREGDDISPPLEWSGVPAGTRELALVCDDPDAPRAHPWVHWVAYKIPADRRELPENANEGFVPGLNDFGETGYSGPMPPPGHGVHHYHFTLYALDAPVSGARGMKKGELLAAIQGHVLATAELIGTYERK
jgi:Raf kinase inhibitor-like YbhB/YbcL family protein